MIRTLVSFLDAGVLAEYIDWPSNMRKGVTLAGMGLFLRGGAQDRYG